MDNVVNALLCFGENGSGGAVSRVATAAAAALISIWLKIKYNVT